MNSKHPLYLCLLAGAGLISSVQAENASDIERITIHADFRSSSLIEVPASVSVIDAMQLEDEGARHFEDVLNSIANLNWSGATSRPRAFQIRGVGDQEDYKGAANSSVGFIVDDIDLSGIGMTASLFDMEQVEILRGPQGTRYGANALAGLIYLKSKMPTDTFEAGIQQSLGTDNYTSLSGYLSGPANDSLLYRVSVQKHQQDGFYRNEFLNMEDTNGRDELTARGKLRWLVDSETTVDLTLLHADFANGYDAWTLDNNGETSLSDQPGEDSQKTQAASLKVILEQAETYDLQALFSLADTDARYAYDGDWANPEFWAEKTCFTYDDDWNVTGQEPCVYNYWWDKRSERTTWSQELRFSSTEKGRLFNNTTDWLVGLYGMRLEESNKLDSAYNGWPDEVLESDYQATNVAIFGQLDSDLGEGLALSVGLRFERRDADYSDDAGDSFAPTENMWGGHLALTKNFSASQQGYLRMARGYKAGGFNTALPSELSDKKQYDQEILYSYELGLKSLWLDNKLSTQAALFYMDREDQQVTTSVQDPENPQRFKIYQGNATSSTSYGLELDMNYRVTSSLTLYGSLGLLEASYDDYHYQDKYGTEVDLSGRDLAHAPHATFSLGASWLSDSGWFANVTTSGKSGFYYSDSHDSTGSFYQLFHAKLGYQAQRWAAYLWGRNLTDKAYGVRGFYFGNRPDLDWTAEQYIRYGDPRQLGVTVAVDF